ncbi:rhodanese-like domain-containing protein [Neobacillus sp. LXY-4]|uniref:rhodanese-like domain-containing protein n=1 Tax=Neobacillus sp. LXY-4 TaxID=3379826 RepID=UPI003EE007E3
MGKKIVFGLVIILFVGFIGFQFMNSSTEIQNISTDELANKMESPESDMVFIDVREPDEFAAGHIPGMTNLPLSTLSEETADFPKDSEVVIICRSGNRSVTAAEQLQGYGFTNLVNVVGGMNDWAGDIE